MLPRRDQKFHVLLRVDGVLISGSNLSAPPLDDQSVAFAFRGLVLELEDSLLEMRTDVKTGFL